MKEETTHRKEKDKAHFHHCFLDSFKGRVLSSIKECEKKSQQSSKESHKGREKTTVKSILLPNFNEKEKYLQLSLGRRKIGKPIASQHQERKKIKGCAKQE